jgi:NAD(P)H-dependent FMN reductase
MITVISGTNRPSSNTLKVAEHYVQLLAEQGVKAELFSLENVPHDLAFSDLFNNRSTRFQQIIDQYILPAQKFVIVSPEYNGSYPGILKTFWDAIPREPNVGKKAALVGVSSGRAGNQRGMEHLTAILHYIGIHVLPNKPPVSMVQSHLGPDGRIKDEHTIKVLRQQAIELIMW